MDVSQELERLQLELATRQRKSVHGTCKSLPIKKTIVNFTFPFSSPSANGYSSGGIKPLIDISDEVSVDQIRAQIKQLSK